MNSFAPSAIDSDDTDWPQTDALLKEDLATRQLETAENLSDTVPTADAQTPARRGPNKRRSTTPAAVTSAQTSPCASPGVSPSSAQTPPRRGPLKRKSATGVSDSVPHNGDVPDLS